MSAARVCADAQRVCRRPALRTGRQLSSRRLSFVRLSISCVCLFDVDVAAIDVVGRQSHELAHAQGVAVVCISVARKRYRLVVQHRDGRVVVDFRFAARHSIRGVLLRVHLLMIQTNTKGLANTGNDIGGFYGRELPDPEVQNRRTLGVLFVDDCLGGGMRMWQAVVTMAGAVDVHAAIRDSQLAHTRRRQRALDVRILQLFVVLIDFDTRAGILTGT